MIIVNSDYLTDEMADSITDLVLDANEADTLRYAVPDDADFYMLAYDDGEDEIIVPEDIDEDSLDPDGLKAVLALYEMGETMDGLPIVELSAFTAPDSRQKGYFKLLYEMLYDTLEDVGIRFAIYENDTNRAVLSAIGAEFDKEELMMSLSLTAGDEDNEHCGGDAKVTEAGGNVFRHEDETQDGGSGIPDNVNAALGSLCVRQEDPELGADMVLTDIPEEGYTDGELHTSYGECFFKLYMDYAYVYGILTYDSYKRQGWAERMLRYLFDYMAGSGINKVGLEVSSDNIPAVSLYKKLGFTVSDRLSYYMVEK